MPPQFQAFVVFVKDVKASRDFYEGLLGQKVMMDHGPNVGFEGGFAIWEVNHAFEIVYQRQPESGDPLGRENFELYFEAADIDVVWQQLSDARVDVVHPIREQPWGQRVFRVHDPDGHVVEIGEPMPVVIMRYSEQGMDQAAIAERTSMPLEVVEMIIDAQLAKAQKG
jgi:catechol 2,3-dioxygenase-like lactoylglutathione lyase family enzyme